MATLTQNRWAIGQMYGGGLLNGNPFYTQPAGPGGKVYPTQKNAQPWPEGPIPGLVINEYVPWWAPPCGHSIKFPKLIKEWDYTTGMDCCLIVCSICEYVCRVVEPYSLVLDPIQSAIVIL